jgi:hypothetical protein
VQSGRLKFCKEANKVGNNWLDWNGYRKKGFTYALIPSPIEPKDIKNELQIMIAARKIGDISRSEFRNWVNTTVVGIRLEDIENFEENNDLGKKVQPKTDPAASKILDKVAEGEDPIQAMTDAAMK